MYTNESIVSFVSKHYMRVVSGAERLVVHLSEYLLGRRMQVSKFPSIRTMDLKKRKGWSYFALAPMGENEGSSPPVVSVAPSKKNTLSISRGLNKMLSCLLFVH